MRTRENGGVADAGVTDAGVEARVAEVLGHGVALRGRMRD